MYLSQLKKIINMYYSMQSKNKFFIGLFLIFTSLTFMSMKSVEVYDPSGTWNYELQANYEVLKGTVTIKKTENSYKVTIETTTYGKLELREVKYKEKVITGNVDVAGVATDFKMKFKHNLMDGTINYGGQEIPFSAKRN